jgi:acyl-CoA dehydrogenase
LRERTITTGRQDVQRTFGQDPGDLLERLDTFLEQHIYPNEPRHYAEMAALRGAAERALKVMVDRLRARIAFGRPLAEQSIWHERNAESRCLIDRARLLAHNAAHMMDTVAKAARAEIAMIKVVAPNMSCKVVDWAIQAHGAAGVSQDFWLAEAYAHPRTVRIVDGPDEVHRNAIAKIELAKWAAARS